MTDDPYAAAAEAWLDKCDEIAGLGDKDDNPFRGAKRRSGLAHLLGRQQLRAAVDAARQPLLDRIAKLEAQLADEREISDNMAKILSATLKAAEQ